MTRRNANTSRFAQIAALLALGASACAPDEPSTPESESEPQVAQLRVPPSRGAMTVNDAEGTYFAAVRTEGTGCPSGTFNTRISDDGQVFTTTFSAFEVNINDRQDMQSLNCRLAINLRSPSGRSFCVQSLSYSGFANLQTGVVGRQLADYYFHDQKARTESAREELVGPLDQEFIFRDDVLPEEELWTPCDQTRELYVDTTLQLQNGATPGNGYINIAATDGSQTIKLKVASHVCDMSRAQGWSTGPFAGRKDVMIKGNTATTTTNNGSGISIGRTVH